MTGNKEDRKPGRGGRMSVKRKMEAVFRVIRGEDLELLSREYGVTAARISQWLESFTMGGESLLKSKPGDGRDEKIRRLEEKVGQVTMDKELLEEKIKLLENGVPFHKRRSRK